LRNDYDTFEEVYRIDGFGQSIPGLDPLRIRTNSFRLRQITQRTINAINAYFKCGKSLRLSVQPYFGSPSICHPDDIVIEYIAAPVETLKQALPSAQEITDSEITKTFYLIRHGESIANFRNDLSIPDPELTLTGILMYISF